MQEDLKFCLASVLILLKRSTFLSVNQNTTREETKSGIPAQRKKIPAMN